MNVCSFKKRGDGFLFFKADFRIGIANFESMSRIRIRNIGPIKSGLLEGDGFVDIRKVTLLIGNQATGKSTLAKLISTLTWMEKVWLRKGFDEKDPELSRRFVEEFIAYQGLRSYIRPETEIDFEGRYSTISYHKGKLRIEALPMKSPRYLVPKIMYVPAERNFLSIVENPQKLEGLPRPLYTFLKEYLDTLVGSAEIVRLPINDLRLEIDSLSRLPFIAGQDYRLRLSESSSGLQSSVPLFIVSRWLANTLGANDDHGRSLLSYETELRMKQELEVLEKARLAQPQLGFYWNQIISKYSNTYFFNIVEEMEQNLYPSSQVSLFFSLLSLANLRVEDQLLLTTHSPYLVNCLTLAVKAAEVLRLLGSGAADDALRRDIEKVVPVSAAIGIEDAAVYEFIEDGTIHKLPTYHGLPSDTNLLNQILGQGNRMFDALLDIEEKI